MKQDLPMTLKEIGDKLGISAERVRQIESVALTKIRKKLKKIGIYETFRENLIDEVENSKEHINYG